MDIQDWMRLYPEYVYDELGDLDITALSRIVDDEYQLGRFLRKRLYAAYEATKPEGNDVEQQDRVERARDMNEIFRRTER